MRFNRMRTCDHNIIYIYIMHAYFSFRCQNTRKLCILKIIIYSLSCYILIYAWICSVGGGTEGVILFFGFLKLDSVIWLQRTAPFFFYTHM